MHAFISVYKDANEDEIGVSIGVNEESIFPIDS